MKTGFLTKAAHFLKTVFCFLGKQLIRFRQTVLPTKKDTFGKICFKIGVLIITVAIIAFSVVSIVRIADRAHQSAIIREDRERWHSTPQAERRFAAMKKRNADFAGWLQIPDTAVDNPVFFGGKENGFYSDHNARKQSASCGALAIAGNGLYRVIYGNCTDDGNLFSSLSKYTGVDYYCAHPDIYFTTEQNCCTYRIFAVFITNSLPKQDNGNLFLYGKTDFLSDAEFDLFLQDAARRSIIRTNISPSAKDNILALVTDSDEFKGAKFVVMAQRLPELEENELPQAEATVVTQPYFPEIWYEKHGLKTPWHKE